MDTMPANPPDIAHDLPQCPGDESSSMFGAVGSACRIVPGCVQSNVRSESCPTVPRFFFLEKQIAKAAAVLDCKLAHN